MIPNQSIKQYWSHLEHHFIPPEAWEGDLLTVWRQRIIFSIFFFASVFGPFALIPSLILSFNEGLWSVFILDSAVYGITVTMLFSKNLALRYKTWVVFSIFYSLGFVLLFILGFYGAGYIWLFGASLIVGVMIGLKAAGIALCMNLLCLVSIGIYIAFGSPEWALVTKNVIEKWGVMTANFMLINSLVTLLVATMLNSLETALSREQKSAGELRIKREEIMAIFKASPDPIIVYDRQDHVRYLNDAFTHTFGWYLEEVQGKIIPIVPEGEQKISCDIYLCDNGNKQGTAVQFETKRNTKYGSTLNILISAAPIESREGNTIGIVVNMKDITDSKRLASKLQQGQKMEAIGTLAGGIAHDFNNILFPILGYTEMMMDDLEEEDPLQESLSNIYTGALRARDLVKQILTFSRQENSERYSLKIQPILKEALKLIRSVVPATIKINQDIDPDCDAIKADPTQIHQILMNLAANANHAMEDTGGELKVSLKKIELMKQDVLNYNMEPGVYACLVVADTGMGMNRNLIKNIFDPFFTTKEKGKGTGMGLSVVHGIVRDMDGHVQVYSEPGRGTQFSVYFPVKRTVSIKQHDHQEKLIQGGTESILLVDDEEAIVDMEKKILSRSGYRVTSRTSSIEALEAFRANPDKFDMIITDMAMPNMSGEKLSSELVKIRPDIPILLCTGFSETMHKDRFESKGIKHFLLKPVITKDLLITVRNVFDMNKTDKCRHVQQYD